MISMMNGGGGSDHTPVEFYSAARSSSLYRNTVDKHKRSYTENGRVLVDGNPISPVHNASEMWSNVLVRGLTQQITKDIKTEKESGTWAKLRRFSSKMRLTKQKSDDFALQMNEDRLAQVEGQGEQQASRGTGYVTMIEVYGVEDEDTHIVQIEEEDEDSKSETDSGKGSIAADELPLPPNKPIHKHQHANYTIIERF
ncbi:hypothetical protein WR25_18379 isoform B [Diploscapter pachys]|uniref:Uncharacterized protein n=1 Tax=Diploscapter pachys TaxID=2018661 RepID=A0A2A2JZI5_9BILA|nr:hypothetical protein WR25_18379 isoform A [Diploscapter pachys]PAV67033.1 hypothetical protein WR25_18379 isoform B [Diploscapter pachys]